MGQAKNRKAEIDALKADNKATMGITFIYEPKGIKDNEVYPTMSIRTNRNGLKSAVKQSNELGLTRNGLYGATREAFKKMDACKGGVAEWTTSDMGRKYATAMIAYLMTFNSAQALGDLVYEHGHIITVKEWSEENTNGAQHGTNRYAFSTDYKEWEKLVSATEADPFLLREVYEPLFSTDPMVRMLGHMKHAGMSKSNKASVFVI
jgi:hypothetical protein